MKEYLLLNEEQLAICLKNGDQHAYTEIYNRYWRDLFRQALWMLCDEDDAIDVVQDVFTALWKNATQMPLILSLRAYLYKATKNQTLNFIYREKTKYRYLESLAHYMDTGHSLTDDEVSYRECDRRIKREVADLPLKMRNIFEKSCYEGLSHQAIAKELNISEHTVKTTVYRALKKLRSRLADLFILICL